MHERACTGHKVAMPDPGSVTEVQISHPIAAHDPALWGKSLWLEVARGKCSDEPFPNRWITPLGDEIRLGVQGIRPSRNVLP